MIATTTLARIREYLPCASGWTNLLRHLGKTSADDEPLPLSVVLDSNGLGDALWCLRACDGIDREARLYAVWCARQVRHLNSDPRVDACLDVAERYANGTATADELAAASAHASAYPAYADASAAAAAYAAAYAAYAYASAAADAYASAAADAKSAQTAEFRRRFCSP